MLRQDISYVDYNGNPRTITEYFHLNEAEIVELQTGSVNGIQADMQDAIISNDAGRVLDFIKMLIHRSYGKKSEDGIHFDKSEEILHKFITSAYYADFVLGLIENDGVKGQAFVTGVMPKALIDRATAQMQGQQPGEVDRTIYGQSAREAFAAAQAAKSPDISTLPFGQPNYPQVNNVPAPEPVAPAAVDNAYTSEQRQQFEAWVAQQTSQASQQSSAPVSPDTFRVPEEEPMQGLPRPPHEQMGNA